ncbi:ABC transporter ATP-binding protein [Marinicrinis sediminis]|uniref:ABC transporter ATP-binding protein n=1 Tax=Marinicrinis sediminis TaxID=1652465 RepID=A0ABW5R8U9_9BACL
MLSVHSVNKSYLIGGKWSKIRQQVLKDIRFQCAEGECLGIVGESGSGKSTLGRLLLGMERPDQGSILFDGKSVSDRKTRTGSMSVVFQDYKSSMNPFYSIEQVIREPLRRQKLTAREQDRKIDDLLSVVGLDRTFRKRYPHELSGGQAQRVCIARAISTEPRCLLLDEAISSLDATVQIQILHLLQHLKQTLRISYLFITHDIQAAAYLCDSMLFLHQGQVVEKIRTHQLKDVQSVYAQKLIHAMGTG